MGKKCAQNNKEKNLFGRPKSGEEARLCAVRASTSLSKLKNKFGSRVAGASKREQFAVWKIVFGKYMRVCCVSACVGTCVYIEEAFEWMDDNPWCSVASTF